MAGIRQVAPEAAAVIERPHHLDVHQVGAAEIGIVDQDHVTRLEVAAPLDDCLGGVVSRRCESAMLYER
jgi:hypothetical protein